MVKGKRRIRSPHPGVVILERTLPSGRKGYQARFRDADDIERKPMLDAALSTAEARKAWAVAKSRELAAVRVARELGDPGVDSRTLSQALKSFHEGAENRLRGKTLATYKIAIGNFELWAQRVGVRTTADLTKAKLANLRDYLIGLPKQVAAKRQERGMRKATAQKRSPVSINRELRTLKTVLNAWRLGGHIRLGSDDISDTLKALPVTHEQPAFLRPNEIKKLLRAALEHDAAVFKETRSEHRGEGSKGSTHRHEAIAPFATVLLLTGMRRGEALALKWQDVDLEAADHEGRPVGEIRLRGEGTKTRRARTVGLEVSPLLRELLEVMHERADGERVFPHHTGETVNDARERLQAAPFNAPPFDWQSLRSTCATYLTNASGIFGAASVFMSAKQLGHSVQIAERHYLNVFRGVPKDAHTLEAAMGIGDVLAEAISSAKSR